MSQLLENSNILIIIAALLLSLFVLSKAADYMVDSAVILSKRLGVSDIIMGRRSFLWEQPCPNFHPRLSPPFKEWKALRWVTPSAPVSQTQA